MCFKFKNLTILRQLLNQYIYQLELSNFNIIINVVITILIKKNDS